MRFTYEAEVEQLFAEALAPKMRTCRNPVTDTTFCPGLDPVSPQKRLAVKALRARDWFEGQRPADAPPLPLTHAGREAIKIDGVGYLVSLIARSLAYCDYDIESHPTFEEYARGVMASAIAPSWIRNDEELLKRYPPKPLKGLGDGLVWRKPQ